MMPGENHSKAAGIASEAAGSCQSCTSLQQNLNEYVAALITLKQKIIDSDHLLTEYQQKCDDLQDAERENKTLRCQIEQMLQKPSTLEQTEEQLKSTRAEFEEKASTLDVVRQSPIKNIGVKEECKKCYLGKKKHEAKLKQLEEVASKHMKNIKRLQQEKRIIERELKKIQKKLGDMQNKKTMTNAQIQVANDQPAVKLDKKKIRILLEEIWGCIESSTKNSDEAKLILGTSIAKEKNFQSPDDCTPSLSHFSPSKLNCKGKTFAESAVVCTSNSSLKCKESNEIHTQTNACKGNKPFLTQTASKDVSVLQDLNDISLTNSDYENDMEELLQIMNWAKPLPHLLSPLKFSPLNTKCMFGEFTDSSDESSEVRDDTVVNTTIYCTTMEKKITCVQDQIKIFQCPEEGNRSENYEQNVEVGTNVKSDAIVVDDIKSQSKICSNHTGDLNAITEMETDKNDIEINAVQIEVSLGTANNTLITNVLTEQNSAEKENTLHCAIKTANSLEEVWYPNLNIPVRKLNRIDNPEAELLNPSSTDMVNKTFCKTSPLQNCNLDEMCSYKCGSTKSLQVDNVNSAGENHESITGAGENYVHNNLSTVKNMEKSNFAIIDGSQDNLLLTSQPEVCVNEFNYQLNNHSKDFKDLKQSKFCFEDDAEKSDSFLTKVEMCFPSETLQLSLDELKEKSGHPSSIPVVQFEHTKLINQHYTAKIDKVDPKYIVELSAQKTNISPEQVLLLSEDGHCGNATSNELGYKMQESLEFIPASTKHSFQKDKASTTSFHMDSSTADEENNLPESAGGDNKCLSTEKLENESKENMDSVLQTYVKKIEEAKASKHDPDESGSKSNCHIVTEQCKISSSEMVRLSSPDVNAYTLVSSKVQETIVVNLQQPGIETQLDMCSLSEVGDAPLCYARHDQSDSSILLNTNETFPSNFDTSYADGCLSKLEEKHGLMKSGMPLLHNQQFDMSMDVSESRDKHDTINKDLCKVVTPKNELNAELDSTLTSQSNNDTLSMNCSQSQVMSILPQGEEEHINIYSESCKVINKISDETDGNRDTCGISLDSSEEDNYPIRKVSYRKAVSSNPVNLKKYCKRNTEYIEEKVYNVHLELNDTPYKSATTPLTDMECAGVLSACNYSETGIVMVHNTFVTDYLIEDPKNGRNYTDNTVDQYTSDKEKQAAILQDCKKPNEKMVSKNINCGNNHCKNIENEGKNTIPGKDFIWNVERPDDSINPKSISEKRKLRTNVKMLNGSSGYPFHRTAFNIEKRPKLNRMNNVKYTDLVFQAVNKESQEEKLSQGECCLQNILVRETILANADTSTNLNHSPEAITKVRTEMGPPLPPLLGPLLATPPKSMNSQSPIMSSSSSSLPSPLDDLISPLPGTPFPQLMSPLSDVRRQKSPTLTTPSPTEKANRRILSSPLQFCAATPKHALPVPGRLPISASSTSSTSVQENSVKILDTMYPELSARARTLNILKGNVQLNRGLPRDGKNVSVGQITGFKPITSTSTAFIKTGGISRADSSKDQLSGFESQQQPSSIVSPSKQTSDSCLMPRSAKRLRMDTESPVTETVKNCSTSPTKINVQVQKHREFCYNISYCELLPDVVKDSSVDEDIITKALKKIEDLCFDLLPVIRSHTFVGTIPKVPVMRNEEKEVIYEFSNSKKSLADLFLQVVLKKIQTGKRSMSTAYLQALCRVYVGLCRQLGDIERARILCYSILKEDFPDPDRMLLFIVSSWNDIISTHGVVSKAVQAVLKSLAKEDVGSCLSAYLNWEKIPPMNVTVLLSSVLMAVQLCPDVKFQQSKKFGEDLPDNIWEYVFAVDLLCSHRKWVWTHDKIISKELWPLLDKWVKRKKGNPNVSFVPDIIAATVLRLVGYLCQMGLKEGFATAVKNIGAVISVFLQHANEEGMSWGVQLACVYMLFDLAPCDPAAIFKTLQAWKEATNNDMPPAVASCMQELKSMCELKVT